MSTQKEIPLSIETRLTLIALCYQPSSKALSALEKEYLEGNPRLQGSQLNKFVETEKELCKKRSKVGVSRPSADILFAKISRDSESKSLGCPDCQNSGDCTSCVQHKDKTLLSL